MNGLKSLFHTLSFILNHPLTKDQRIASIIRFGKWQLVARLHKGLFITPFANNLMLLCRKRLTGASGNLYVGLHEFYDMAFAVHFLRKDDFFCDIGANVGSYAVLTSGLTNCRSIAFEPSTKARQIFEWNVFINGLSDRVTISPVAISDQAGTERFSTTSDTTNTILYEEHTYVDSETVKTETLDNMLGEHTPTLIKVDVEGHEPHVLRGAAKTLNDPRCKAIIIEVLSHREEILLNLAKYGFRQVYYDPFTRSLKTSENYQFTTSNNLVFVKDINEARERVLEGMNINVLNKVI